MKFIRRIAKQENIYSSIFLFTNYCVRNAGGDIITLLLFTSYRIFMRLT